MIKIRIRRLTIILDHPRAIGYPQAPRTPYNVTYSWYYGLIVRLTITASIVKRLSDILGIDGILKEIVMVEEALSELPNVLHQTGDVMHILDQLDGESRWDKFTERFTCE